jgi:hypothetical protein
LKIINFRVKGSSKNLMLGWPLFNVISNEILGNAKFDYYIDGFQIKNMLISNYKMFLIPIDNAIVRMKNINFESCWFVNSMFFED